MYNSIQTVITCNVLQCFHENITDDGEIKYDNEGIPFLSSHCGNSFFDMYHTKIIVPSIKYLFHVYDIEFCVSSSKKDMTLCKFNNNPIKIMSVGVSKGTKNNLRVFRIPKIGDMIMYKQTESDNKYFIMLLLLNPIKCINMMASNILQSNKATRKFFRTLEENINKKVNDPPIKYWLLLQINCLVLDVCHKIMMTLYDLLMQDVNRKHICVPLDDLITRF